MLRWKKASGTSRGIELSDLQHMLLEHHLTLQDSKDVSDWNEFRIVLAIGRAGSLVGAAKDLGHDHSTIFRWLNAIERRRGVQLFDRTSSQYTPTEAGFQMVMAAERLETEILAIDRSITGQDARLSGKLNSCA